MKSEITNNNNNNKNHTNNDPMPIFSLLLLLLLFFHLNFIVEREEWKKYFIEILDSQFSLLAALAKVFANVKVTDTSA